MAMNVSEFVWRRVHEWGIKRVYGYPGDGVGGLDVALEKAKDKLQYVQVRHEEMAAFMASAHAKFTGEVGLCYATSGPGAIHLLNGLYDAKMDHVPVVAIVGQQARTAIGASYQQEVDLQSLFKDVAADFVATASVPGAGAASDRSRGADRSDAANRHLRHHSERPAGTRLRRSAGGARHHAHRRRLRRPGAAAERYAAAAGRGGAERRQEGRDAGRRGRARRHRRGDRGRAKGCRPASPRRCSARPRCRTTCPGSPARSACSAPSRRGI